ncbi:MAG: ribulose-phosphate 3-epimerase [Clostridia bacterium]
MKISPSILAADFANLESDIKKVENSADALHLDVMDGVFVPNISFGLPIVKAIRKVTDLPLDVHLMIENPGNYIEDFAKIGSDYITVHAEACRHLNRTINKIKELGCKAGVSLNPHTDEAVLKYLIKDIDLVLVMSVNPGFGGQSFIKEMLNKIKNIKKMIEKENEEVIIAVDGGINQHNISEVYKAGATFIIAGSAVFKSDDPAKAIDELKNSVK